MSLKGLLNQTVTLYASTGKDKYGRESYDTSTDYNARVQLTTKSRIVGPNETVEIVAIVYFDKDVSISKGDKVTYNSVDYRVFGVYTAVDGAGSTDHTKVELVKWA